MEALLKFIESANKYGIPIPLIVLILGVAIWAALTVRWSEREKYYYGLLDALGKWKDSVTDRKDYYMEPGSEYRDATITVIPRFKALTTREAEAFNSLRDQLNVARIFLSEKSVTLLDGLLSDHWLICEMDALCTKDYLEKTEEVVSNAYSSLLLDAKLDLKRSRYLALMKKILAK